MAEVNRLRFVNEKAIAIGTTMGESRCHCLEIVLSTPADEPDDPTHLILCSKMLTKSLQRRESLLS
jgi:hypothetical protein